MIPRRLLTVMLLLLVGLVIASIVAPPPEGDDDETAQTSTASTATTPTTTAPADPEPAEPAEPADEERAVAKLDGVAAVLPRDETVRARPGEPIDLRVTSGEPATIEIPALGMMQPAAPRTPAQFVVAFDAPGRYDVRALETDRSVGTVVITG